MIPPSPICPKCKILMNRNYQRKVYECPLCGKESTKEAPK